MTAIASFDRFDLDMKQSYLCGVQCLVLKNKRVLLGLRHNTSCAGEWALPGGHVEFGESPSDAARRELQEETSLVGTDPLAGPSYITYTTDLPYVHVPILFKKSSGSPVITRDEKFSEVGYFPLSALPSPMFLPSVTALSLLGTGFVDKDVAQRSGYLKVDMIDGKGKAGRVDRGYSVLLARDSVRTFLVRSWGSRQSTTWSHNRKTLAGSGEGIADVNRIVREKLRAGYVIAGLAGEMELTRALTLDWGGDELRVVSLSFLDSLATNEEFRVAFLKDWTRLQAKLPFI